MAYDRFALCLIPPYLTISRPTIVCYTTLVCLILYLATQCLLGQSQRLATKFCQVFATNFGWAHAHPLKQKGEAHEVLSLMF
jgi:hypothetical protein